MVWLVIGGPAIVVVASFTTLGLVLTHPDPVLPTAPQAADDAQSPAMHARNHVITGDRHEVPAGAAPDASGDGQLRGERPAKP
jgi:hypothetical protein